MKNLLNSGAFKAMMGAILVMLLMRAAREIRTWAKPKTTSSKETA